MKYTEIHTITTIKQQNTATVCATEILLAICVSTLKIWEFILYIYNPRVISDKLLVKIQEPDMLCNHEIWFLIHLPLPVFSIFMLSYYMLMSPHTVIKLCTLNWTVPACLKWRDTKDKIEVIEINNFSRHLMEINCSNFFFCS
jgi:hypothetical protein